MSHLDSRLGWNGGRRGSRARILQERTLIALFVVVFSLAAPLDAPVSAVASAYEAGTPSEAEVEAAKTFRKSFGLRSDEAYVREVFGTRESREFRYGVPLTRSEEANLAWRGRVANSLNSLYPEFSEDPHQAGMWIDQERGGVVVAQWSDNADRSALVARWRQSLPPGTALEAHQVQFSAADLAALAGRVTADVPLLRLEGVKLTVVATIHRLNKVMVGVEDLTEAKRLRLERAYDRRQLSLFDDPWGSSDEHNRENSPGPLMGGIVLERDISSTLAALCTAGFIVKRGSNPVEYFILTAGHCNGEGNERFTTGSRWDHNYESDWTLMFNLYATATNADVAAIDIPEDDASNFIIENDNRASWLLGVDPVELEGEPRFMSGITTRGTYGKVTASSATVIHDGITLTDMALASYQSASGDSGAPVYNEGGEWQGKTSVWAAGIHKGTVNTVFGFQRAYSKMNNILTRLGASLETSYVWRRLRPIHSLASNRCLDVEGGAQQPEGAALHQWECLPVSSQRWLIVPRGDAFQIESQTSPTNRCIDIPQSNSSNGTVLIEWSCHGGANQRWYFVQEVGARYTIRSKLNNKCFDIAGASLVNGAKLTQWDCVGGTQNQIWQQVRHPGD